jgi:WD40 repeat protein
VGEAIPRVGDTNPVKKKPVVQNTLERWKGDADLAGIHAEVRALAFSPDGRTVASAGVSRMIRLSDPVTGQELLTLGDAREQVNALTFSPDGRTLASADHGGLVRLYRGAPDLNRRGANDAFHGSSVLVS